MDGLWLFKTISSRLESIKYRMNDVALDAQREFKITTDQPTNQQTDKRVQEGSYTFNNEK